jgi:hypothetical protein
LIPGSYSIPHRHRFTRFVKDARRRRDVRIEASFERIIGERFDDRKLRKRNRGE